MNKLCRFATVAAVVVAASAFATQASANPFAWLGLGYTPTDNGNQVRADLQRRTVEYPTNEAPGTIIIDTANTYLYYVLPGGKAIRYGIGVGARAMYLSGSFYRIHGTNAPGSIGSRATAGCIRMANDDVIDLYDRVKVGTKVVVMPAAERRAAAWFNPFQ